MKADLLEKVTDPSCKFPRALVGEVVQVHPKQKDGIVDERIRSYGNAGELVD